MTRFVAVSAAADDLKADELGVFVVLLRGVNVGGNNLIKMSELTTCLQELGFDSVRTHANSGNAVFRSNSSDVPALTTSIEQGLLETFAMPSRVVVKSHAQLRTILAAAPKGFGANPSETRDDVVFLKPPLTAAKAIQVVRTRAGVDTATAGKEALYFTRIKRLASKSMFPKIASTPEYQLMTVRTLGTAIKLLQLMETC